MKNILLGSIFLLTYTFADISANIMTPIDLIDTERANSATQLPARPIRPKKKHILMRQYNHYNTNVIENCDQYVKIIEEKDKEIKALKEEIDRLRNVAQTQLQKKLREEHAKEMKKFDERKSGIRTQNRMNISNEPVK